MEFNRVAEYIQASLMGKRLRYIVRSCDLIDFGFGDTFIRKNRHGKNVEVAAFALHLQCPFRITRQDRILIGSDDLFFSSSSGDDNMDLRMKDTCILDDKLKLLQDLFSKESVTGVSMSPCGDIFLQLSTLNVSAFCTGSTGNEMWRFFETGTDKPHIICTGLGFEIV